MYPRQHALCIGINDYASPGIPDLSYAEADARDVAGVLRDLYGYDDVRLLLGKGATRKGISDAIAALFDPKNVGKDDAVLVYFSGHGQTVRSGSSESGYLIPQDAQIALAEVANPAPYRRDALRMDDLRTDADGIPAKHVLFLVDACYSGYLASRSVDAPPAIASALKYPARQVITAGTAGEQALEHNAWGHGAFTYKLLQILQTEDKPLQATALGVMLKQRVPPEVAAKFGKDRTLSPQAKYLSGDGDFIFLRKGRVLAQEPEPQTPAPPPVQHEQSSDQPNTTIVDLACDAGHVLRWRIDERWRAVSPASTMRKAQFVLPRAPGDTDDAELVVYHFGVGSGGGVTENIDRWVRQFSRASVNPPIPPDYKTEVSEVGDMRITTVDVSGCYHPPEFPGSPPESRENYRLLGACIETPSGIFYVKCIGPASTIAVHSASVRKSLKTVVFH